MGIFSVPVEKRGKERGEEGKRRKKKGEKAREGEIMNTCGQR